MMAWLMIALLVGTMTWMFCALSVVLVRSLRIARNKEEDE